MPFRVASRKLSTATTSSLVLLILSEFHPFWPFNIGIDADKHFRLPTGVGIALKIAQWLDPALEADLSGESPRLLSPLLCAMNGLGVFPPNSPEVAGHSDLQSGSLINLSPPDLLHQLGTFLLFSKSLSLISFIYTPRSSRCRQRAELGYFLIPINAPTRHWYMEFSL